MITYSLHSKYLDLGWSLGSEAQSTAAQRTKVSSSTYLVATTTVTLVAGDPTPSLSLWAPGMHVVHRHMSRKNIHMCQKKSKKNFIFISTVKFHSWPKQGSFIFQQMVALDLFHAQVTLLFRFLCFKI